MKKFIVSLGAIFTAFALCGCSVNAVNKNDSLYDRGMSIIEKMDSMAESQDYISLFTGEGTITDKIKSMGEGDYSAPKAVYKITITNAELDRYIQGDNDVELSEELQEEVRKKVVASIPTYINAMNGAETLAASSIITTGDSFLSDESTYQIYFYLYDGEYSAAVSFVPNDEGIVNATGVFITNEALNEVKSPENMAQWLMDYANIIDCEIEEMTK